MNIMNLLTALCTLVSQLFFSIANADEPDTVRYLSHLIKKGESLDVTASGTSPCLIFTFSRHNSDSFEESFNGRKTRSPLATIHLWVGNVAVKKCAGSTSGPHQVTDDYHIDPDAKTDREIFVLYKPSYSVSIK